MEDDARVLKRCSYCAVRFHMYKGVARKMRRRSKKRGHVDAVYACAPCKGLGRTDGDAADVQTKANDKVEKERLARQKAARLADAT